MPTAPPPPALREGPRVTVKVLGGEADLYWFCEFGRFDLREQGKTVRRAGLPVYVAQMEFHRSGGYKEAFPYFLVGFTR
ncbi:hypothetical protein FACS189450_11700 [Spirochaetia bacterium]|nr:hypothetical protein FACS189450_11700 [Spirochaetia bacterium]